ncbi:MAG: hypothetical protein HY744_06420 [Deltaproteobacteria bacterium]|nr:hypothetical protein [Deltaproteobacteria bacterium]
MVRALRRLALLLALWVAALPLPAAALEVDRKYEQELVRWALAEEHLEPEPSPEGKRIERIAIVREDIIAASDPLPGWLNYVHVKTRDEVVRQELLVQPGEPWDQAKMEESLRSLRKLFILSVARAVPCKSARPGQVILLVVTKDLWSIRTNLGINQTGGVMKRLELTPTEENFLGRNKRVSLHLLLSQLDYDGSVVRDKLAVGQGYRDPRLFGSRLELSERFDALVDGDVPCAGAIGEQGGLWCPQGSPGSVSGIATELALGRPLYALGTSWGFRIQGSADIRQQRSFRQNTDPAAVPLGERPGLSLRALPWDGHPDGVPRAVPFVYDSQRLLGSASLTRSFGEATKHNFSSGLGVYRRESAPPAGFPFDEPTRAWYAREFLPYSESAAFFFLGYASYTGRSVRWQNVDTFAISEDFWLGHNVALESRLGNNLLRRDEPFAELEGRAGYRWQLGGNLLWASAAAGTRGQPEHDDLAPRYDDIPLVGSQLQLGMRHVSPRLGIGRLHTQFLAHLRHNDRRRWMDVGSLVASGQSWPLVAPWGLTSELLSLGADSGLRGYPADQFQGPSLARVNVEYRRLPLNIFTLHCGFALFYDAGAVFGDGLQAAYKHTLGLGLRGHFPQFDKETLRVDFGVPLQQDRGSVASWFAFAFGQAF